MSIADYQVAALIRLAEIVGEFALHWTDRATNLPSDGGAWQPQSKFNEKAFKFMRAKNIHGCDLFGRLPNNTWACFDDVKKNGLPKNVSAVYIETSKNNFQALVHFDREWTKDEYSHLKRVFKSDPGANGHMFRLPGFVNRKRALKAEGEFMARLITADDKEVPVVILDDLLARTHYVAPRQYVSTPTQKRKKESESVDSIWARCVAECPTDRSRAEYRFVLNLFNKGWSDEEAEAELEARFDPEAHKQKKGEDYIKNTIKNARRIWRPPTAPQVPQRSIQRGAEYER